MITEPFIPPSVEEKIANFQRQLLDMQIDPTAVEFGQAVDGMITAFCQKTPAAKIAYHSHMHMGKGVAICFLLGASQYLWMSVFPDIEEHKGHRATVCMARRSIQAKVDGCILCATYNDAATAIISEIKRVCKI